MQEPRTKDWVSTVKENIEDLEIKLHLINWGKRNHQVYQIAHNSNKIKAFEYLKNKKLNHDKVRQLAYKNLEMANYLKASESEYSVENMQYLIQCRVNDIQARANRS